MPITVLGQQQYDRLYLSVMTVVICEHCCDRSNGGVNSTEMREFSHPHPCKSIRRSERLDGTSLGWLMVGNLSHPLGTERTELTRIKGQVPRGEGQHESRWGEGRSHSEAPMNTLIPARDC